MENKKTNANLCKSVRSKNDKGYRTILAIPDLDRASATEAKSIFSAYRNKGIIKYGWFDDECWYLTNEVHNFTFDFSIEDNDYNQYEKILQMTKEEFIDYLKTYVVYRFGELCFGSLSAVIRSVKKILACPIEKLSTLSDNEYVSAFSGASEFFTMLPADNRNQYLHTLYLSLEKMCEGMRSKGVSNKRLLAALESYFRFTEILETFWQNASDDEKIFYFPVWMWWNITGILPTRPTEFIMTRRECLSRRSDGWYLELKKSRLKGRDKPVSYFVEEDYESVRYRIPDDIAETINWYIKETEKYDCNQLGTLFITDTHYAKWDRCKPFTSRYFTYANMNTCLRYFFENIVKGIFGYEVIFDRKKNYLNDNEIHYMTLGDSRHLSMINLIYNGATPTIAMILAGHENPTIASHYFSNIPSLIECKVYRQFKRTFLKESEYRISKNNPVMKFKDPVLLPDGSLCYSTKMKHGDFTDCMKICGPGGEIGYCNSCDFHRAQGNTFFDGKEDLKHSIELEGKMLAKIADKVRKNNGEKEDLIKQIMKLKSAEYSYQRYCEEVFAEQIREEENGQKKNNK